MFELYLYFLCLFVMISFSTCLHAPLPIISLCGFGSGRMGRISLICLTFIYSPSLTLLQTRFFRFRQSRFTLAVARKRGFNGGSYARKTKYQLHVKYVSLGQTDLVLERKQYDCFTSPKICSSLTGLHMPLISKCGRASASSTSKLHVRS